MLFDWIFVILNIGILFLIFSSYDKRFFLNFAISSATFIVEFLVASNLLLAINSFKVAYCLVFAFIVNVIILSLRCINGRNEVFEGLKHQDYKFDVVIVILIIASLFFSWKTNGYYGLNQDEGVYTTAAIARANDYPSLRLSFPDEVEVIESIPEINTDSYKEKFKVSNLGFYVSQRNYFTNEVTPDNNLEGVFHGLPSYPCLLGLSAQMFGYRNMMVINHFIVLIQGIFLSYLLKNLQQNKFITWAAFALCSICPVLIWVNKSSLTENLFVLYFFMLFAFLTDEKNKLKYFLFSIACWGICFVHLSAYVYMPFFGFIIAYEAIRVHKPEPLVWGQINGFVFLLSHLYAEIYAVDYTYHNYSILLEEIFHPKNGYTFGLYLSLGVTIAMIGFGFLLFVPWVRNKFGVLIKSDGFSKAVRIGVILVMLFAVYKTFKYFVLGKQTLGQAITYSTFYGISILSGVVLFPIALILVLISIEKIRTDRLSFVFGAAFVYMVVAQITLFRVTTSYYYYYARYLSPILFIVAITAIVFFPKFKGAGVILPVLMVLGTAYLFPYSWYLSKTQDDTVIEYDDLFDIVSEFKESDAVVVDSELASTFMFPVKLMTNADVYVLTGNSGDMFRVLNEHYDDVYFVTYNERSNIEQISVRTIEQYLDNQPYRSVKLFPLDDISKTERNVFVYKYDWNDVVANVINNTNNDFNNMHESRVSIDDFIMHGGFHPDDVTVVWTSSDTSSFSFYLPNNFRSEDIATLVFTQGILPDFVFEEYIITVEVNGQLVGDFDIFSNPYCMLSLEDGLVAGEYNTITIYSTPWCPHDYGMPDTRIIGARFEYITLVNN